jgi:hypothetical protein
VARFWIGFTFVSLGLWETLTGCIGVMYWSGATGVEEEVDGGDKLLIGNDTITLCPLLFRFRIESLVLAVALWHIVMFVQAFNFV